MAHRLLHADKQQIRLHLLQHIYTQCSSKANKPNVLLCCLPFFFSVRLTLRPPPQITHEHPTGLMYSCNSTHRNLPLRHALEESVHKFPPKCLLSATGLHPAAHNTATPSSKSKTSQAVCSSPMGNLPRPTRKSSYYLAVLH